MAITRCPYCHAIIDENDKYCNNCGTQLLFTEDEEIEEEIPGEKIIEADVEEKDYTVDEPENEKRPAAKKDLDSEIDSEEELDEKAEETALDKLIAAEAGEEDDEDVTEEVILVDEIEAAEAKSKDGSAALEKPDTVEVKGPEREESKGADAEGEEAEKTPEALPPSPAEPDIEYASGSETPDAAATAGEAGLLPATFDSQELENLGKTVDLSREKIDKFLEVMTEKKVETGPVPAASAPEKTPEPPTGTLPPWASTMKGAPVFPEDTGPVETRKIRGGEPGSPNTEEVEIFPRQRTSDSTMGLPEKVNQAPLPFERRTEELEEVEEVEEAEGGEEEREEEGTTEDEIKDVTPEEVVLPGGQVGRAREPFLPVREREPERPAGPEIEAAGEVEEPAPRPPFSFSVFLKSKTFDLLFVGLFWLVALWLAASSMGLTLFGILGSMSGSMLLLYAVFVLLYFFLFKFFLGETLGDRLFRPRE